MPLPAAIPVSCHRLVASSFSTSRLLHFRIGDLFERELRASASFNWRPRGVQLVLTGRAGCLTPFECRVRPIPLIAAERAE